MSYAMESDHTLFNKNGVVFFNENGVKDVENRTSRVVSLGTTSMMYMTVERYKKNPMEKYIIRESKIGVNGQHIVKITNGNTWYFGDWFTRVPKNIFEDIDFTL